MKQMFRSQEGGILRLSSLRCGLQRNLHLDAHPPQRTPLDPTRLLLLSFQQYSRLAMSSAMPPRNGCK